MNGRIALKAEGIVKRFTGVIALKGVDFDLEYGEVHVILGQNGAGKSTLSKVLAGILRPDAGSIIVKDKKVNYLTPKTARKFGIFLTHQEIMLCPNLSVEQNILIALRSVKPFFRLKTLDDEHIRILEEVGLKVNPSIPVSWLSVGEQQLLQVAISIILGADILLFDEPTSSLSFDEVETLFNLIRRLKKEGKAIALITHRINEVFEIGDRVTVLRDGYKISTKKVEETSVGELVNMVAGKTLEEIYVEKPYSQPDKHDPVFEVEDLTTQARTTRGITLKSVSFKLYRGEVLAVLGLLGAGKTELAKAIIGLERVISGRIKIDGKEVRIKSPKDAKRYGIYYLPENRRVEGIVPIMNLKDNIVLPIITRISKHKLVRNFSEESSIANSWVKRLRIVAPSIFVNVGSLSGGNQQKVIIAKYLEAKPRILIFDEPTMGIDIGAKAEIRRIIRNLIEENKDISILLLTSDIDEALSLADRIAIISEGSIIGIFKKNEIAREKLVELVGKGGN